MAINETMTTLHIKTGSPLPLGASVIGDCVNFSVSSPVEATCELLLYKKGSAVPDYSIPMGPDDISGLVRSVMVPVKEVLRYEYNYQINGQIIPDPFGKDFTGRSSWNADRDVESHAVRTRIAVNDFEWENDVPLHIPYKNVIAYSLHVRGFTKHVSSKIKHKGTFLGLVEKLPYLKELGINQIQCMPVYDFEERLEYTNYWGYGDAYFFAPKSAYAATQNAVAEFKQLVKTLHKEGIEIVLEMPFTGNCALTQIVDCLRYYAAEYHVDGFIVNPLVACPGELRKDPYLARTKIMSKRDDFQNTMRRFLKGDEGTIPDVIWWFRHHSEDEGIFNYVASHNGFTLNDVFSYDSKHNEANGENNCDGPDYNYSWNCGVEGPSRKKSVVALRHRQIRNAFLLLLLSQGTPCILAGDEFLNTQKGNNNVYCQDNSTAWLDWGHLLKEEETFKFVKELIRFRKEHKLLYPQKELKGEDTFGFGVPDISFHGRNAWQEPTEVSSRQLGIYLSGKGEEAPLYLAMNMHWLPHIFALPRLSGGKKWYEIISTDEGVLEVPVLVKSGKEIELEERTIKVFIGK